MKSSRRNGLEEPSLGDRGSQRSGKVGRPDGAPSSSSPPREQVGNQNEGPRAVALVGPDSTTVDEGAQGPAHLEGEPAVDSPGGAAGHSSAGRRVRRVGH